MESAAIQIFHCSRNPSLCVFVKTNTQYQLFKKISLISNNVCYRNVTRIEIFRQFSDKKYFAQLLATQALHN